ncbi:MAG: UDP-2,3-diacetamido-2,3-dideoxy-D-glucuronate 2-epimerase [Planctomycetes bacterium]|nr:UDP-2,3-diacetamido-2,3-dideoxy-D-glucuronate 2-epimerase [Planctomycetota bacterium]
MRIVTVVGARPQFVKAAPVSREIRKSHEEILVHTGQHYDEAMSEVFFRELRIPPPDVNLRAGSGAPGPRLASMIRGIADVLAARRPDALLVYGDTDSTLAGALAASEAGVPVAHVEAGLRSHNLRMPEEVNRIAADHVSALLLCPTPGAAQTLADEKVRGRVEVVGDVMLDACLSVAEAGRAADVPSRLGLARGGYYASTLHRQENTDDPSRLLAIVSTLDALDLPVVLPCHPRTRGALAKVGFDRPRGGLRLVDPLPYSEMMGLVADARGLLTDSGGLQKEAYFLGVPCVTLRDETEWTETVASGWNRLAGADASRIREAVRLLRAPGAKPDLAFYGDGRASARVAALVSTLASGIAA